MTGKEGAVARILRREWCWHRDSKRVLERLTGEFVELFRADNPRFNSERFWGAVWKNEPTDEKELWSAKRYRTGGGRVI